MQDKKNLIKTTSFVNGRFIDSDSRNNFIKKLSPANKQTIPSIESITDIQLEQCIEDSLQIFKSGIWSKSEIAHRKKVLMKWSDLIEKEIENLAYLDALETGRSYNNFLYDSYPKAIQAMRWFCEAVDKITGDFININNSTRAIVTRESLGLIGIITPWNDPMVISMWKAIPALLMGNSLIIKPAEESSYSILRAVELSKLAGVPDGVINVVLGSGEDVGKKLALSNKIQAIFFTGSSEIGKKILIYSGSSNMKKVGLECGGKSAFILTKNYKDLRKAAKVLAKNIFYNQGQICSAPSRLIIQNSIKDVFLPILIKESKKYIPKNTFASDAIVSSVVSEKQFKKINEYIELAKKEKLKITNLVDREKISDKGFYVYPVIIENPIVSSRIFQEEIFGPVLSLVEFDTIEEAVELANSVKYGLAGSIWTDEISEAIKISEAIQSGIVHINSYGDDDISIPFGGIKESGIGFDKSLKVFDEYSNMKSIVIGL